MKTRHAVTPTVSGAAHAPAKHPGHESESFERLMGLMARQHGRTIEFTIAAGAGSRVYVAGTFNQWNPETHPLRHHPEEGVFKATLFLEEGTHEYKFVVDGIWHADAKCPHWVLNEKGTLNSVVHVAKHKGERQ